MDHTVLPANYTTPASTSSCKNIDVRIDKKLSCRRETARRFMSLNILLSLKIIRNDTVA